MKKTRILLIPVMVLAVIAFASPKIYTAAASEGSFMSNIAKSVGLVKIADAEKKDDKKYKVCAKYIIRFDGRYTHDYYAKNPHKALNCTQRKTVIGEKEKQKYDKRYRDLVNSLRKKWSR